MEDYKRNQREKWEHGHPDAAKDKEHQYQKGVWHPLLGYENLINAQKEEVSVEELKGQNIAIYFGAHWSKPNTNFTPLLIRAYQEYNRTCPRNKRLEVLFVSCDESEGDMWQYISDYNMPWVILPFHDHRKNDLMGRFHVNDLPKLVVVDPKGNCLATDLQHESIVKNIEIEGATFFSKILGHASEPSSASSI